MATGGGAFQNLAPIMPIHSPVGFGWPSFCPYAAMLSSSRTKTGAIDSHETGYGLGLSYSSGAFSVGSALQQFRERDGAGIKHTRTEYGLAASYDFGPAKLFSHYMASKHSIPGGAFSKWEHANIGVSVPVSDSLTLMAEYGRNRVKARVYDDTPPNAYLGQIKGHTNYIQFGIRHTF